MMCKHFFREGIFKLSPQTSEQKVHFLLILTESGLDRRRKKAAIDGRTTGVTSEQGLSQKKPWPVVEDSDPGTSPLPPLPPLRHLLWQGEELRPSLAPHTSTRQPHSQGSAAESPGRLRVLAPSALKVRHPPDSRTFITLPTSHPAPGWLLVTLRAGLYL